MTTIILLAAGESSRFGSPKQLVKLGGETLLRRAARTALESGIGPVTVVLGAAAEPCRRALAGIEVNIVFNAQWKEGIASSIVAGVRNWWRHSLEGALILLADQPGVTAQHLRNLLASASASSNPVVASRYAGQLGVPAWFAHRKFQDLLRLEGARGAKEVILREPGTAWIDWPEAAFDVDTPEDLTRVSLALGRRTGLS
ncbi:MAG: nucleotidyltransferase family protein [Verrucomicrobiota bacterium]